MGGYTALEDSHNISTCDQLMPDIIQTRNEIKRGRDVCFRSGSHTRVRTRGVHRHRQPLHRPACQEPAEPTRTAVGVLANILEG